MSHVIEDERNHNYSWLLLTGPAVSTERWRRHRKQRGSTRSAVDGRHRSVPGEESRYNTVPSEQQ